MVVCLKKGKNYQKGKHFRLVQGRIFSCIPIKVQYLITSPVRKVQYSITSPVTKVQYLITFPVTKVQYLITFPVTKVQYLITFPVTKVQYLITSPVTKVQYLITYLLTPFNKEFFYFGNLHNVHTWSIGKNRQTSPNR